MDNQIASQSASANAQVAAAQYLMFSLGEEAFATSIQSIREIIEYPGLTGIPLTPEFLRGVINLRGAVVPVIDLSVRFGRSKTAIGNRTCIVIVEAQANEERHLVGVIVDGVTEVLEVEQGNVEQRPNFGAGVRSEFVAGMINKDERFIVALDMDKILSAEELEALIQSKQDLDISDVHAAVSH
jgi:purine-binding chemotaxis protein CheW